MWSRSLNHIYSHLHLDEYESIKMNLKDQLAKGSLCSFVLNSCWVSLSPHHRLCAEPYQNTPSSAHLLVLEIMLRNIVSFLILVAFIFYDDDAYRMFVLKSLPGLSKDPGRYSKEAFYFVHQSNLYGKVQTLLLSNLANLDILWERVGPWESHILYSRSCHYALISQLLTHSLFSLIGSIYCLRSHLTYFSYH